MKILVAGGLGFIGSYLVEDLYGKGYKITVYDVEAPRKKIDGVNYVQGDICDREKLREALKGVEIVYHLAGEASIERAIENPENTVRANILGTTILLEECVKAKIKRFVFGSTVYV
jgi:nucleoside-diphosphate-sugar epimerase